MSNPLEGIKSPPAPLSLQLYPVSLKTCPDNENVPPSHILEPVPASAIGGSIIVRIILSLLSGHDLEGSPLAVKVIVMFPV